MEDAQIHGSMYRLDHCAAVVPSILVTELDRFCFPVGPVDPVFPNGNGEDVMQVHARMHIPVNDHFPITTFQITDGYEIFAGITPEEFVRFEADRQGIWPTEVVLDQHSLVRSVHAGFADVRLIAPVGPVHVSAEGIQYDCPWLLEILRNQYLPIPSIQFGDLDRVQTFVTPVQIPRNPIDRQTVRILEGGLVQSFRAIRTQAHAFDRADYRVDVGPVVALGFPVKVQRHCV